MQNNTKKVATVYIFFFMPSKLLFIKFYEYKFLKQTDSLDTSHLFLWGIADSRFNLAKPTRTSTYRKIA